MVLSKKLKRSRTKSKKRSKRTKVKRSRRTKVKISRRSKSRKSRRIKSKRKSKSRKSRKSKKLRIRRIQRGGSNDSPVVVLFHAEWCGHCKKLMPVWNELKGVYGSNLLDFEESSMPDIIKNHNVNGFPTIKYLPTGINNPNGAIDYEGDRSYESLKEFIDQYIKN